MILPGTWGNAAVRWFVAASVSMGSLLSLLVRPPVRQVSGTASDVICFTQYLKSYIFSSITVSNLTQTANIPPQMFRSRTTWLRCRRVDENPALVRSG